MIMEGPMEQLVEELHRTDEDLVVVEGEKDRLLGEIKKMKQVAKVAGMEMPTSNGLNTEVCSLKELLSNSKDELKQKDVAIKSLEIELANVKKLETELTSRDSLIDHLRQELNIVTESESHVPDLSADTKQRIMELEAEVDRRNMSECKMFESLQQQQKLLEEARLELASLQKKVDIKDVNKSGNKENNVHSTEKVGVRKSELQQARDQLSQALHSERMATMKTKGLQDELAIVKNELGLVKNELKQAYIAEETCKKAMDELAIALREVARDSNLTKEKHQHILLELENVKEESEQLRDMLQSTEERYQKLSGEGKKESKIYKNTTERLRLEAEETLLAWNAKEMGFVTCIKTAEEEKAVAQHEKAKLAEALKAAETMARSAREENYKLRDILKQAINETNAAKAAASIAIDENSVLKDSLYDKDEALLILNKENERLRINGVAAKENLKELKKLLSSVSMQLKLDNNGEPKSSNSDDDEHDVDEEDNGKKRTFSFDLDELKVIDEQDSEGEKTKPEDPEKAEALKGSILDINSPKSEPHTPISVPNHQRGHSTTFIPYEDRHHLYDIDSDTNNCTRKKKLFRRVSDIILRKKMIQRV